MANVKIAKVIIGSNQIASIYTIGNYLKVRTPKIKGKTKKNQ